MLAGLNRLARKLTNCGDCARIAPAALLKLDPTLKIVEPGGNLSHAGEKTDRIYLICQGWAVCHCDLEDGNCQVMNFLLPGDFACLGAGIYTRCNTSTTAITRLQVMEFTLARLMAMMRANPDFAHPLLWIAEQENAILAEHLVSVGRRTAYQRTAHLLLELWHRLRQVGLAEGCQFAFPVAQPLFADALGLTPIHISRTIQRLKGNKLIEVQFSSGKRAQILNLPEAMKAASFNSAYLNIANGAERPPVSFP